jgi:hypothetical protein
MAAGGIGSGWASTFSSLSTDCSTVNLAPASRREAADSGPRADLPDQPGRDHPGLRLLSPWIMPDRQLWTNPTVNKGPQDTDDPVLRASNGPN